MLVGVWLILIGADQVKPPSVDIEKAMLVYWKLLKRASCQTAYRVPLAGFTAGSKDQLWVSMPMPPSGLGTPRAPGMFSVSFRGRMSATRVGVVCQDCPWSVDRRRETLKSKWFVPPASFLYNCSTK